MSDISRKDSVRKALEGYYKRTEVKSTGRKNGKPEELISISIRNYLNYNGWSVNWYESKAVYNPKIGRYMNSQMVPGHSDLAGTTPEGIACYIEVKNIGKRNTLRDNQREFLMEKISKNCFACVATSISEVISIFNQWQLMKLPPNFKQAFLLKQLPIEKEDKTDLNLSGF